MRHLTIDDLVAALAVVAAALWLVFGAAPP